LEVQTVFHWPYSLQSTVVRQDGSDFIREHVFDKIIEAESDMAVSEQADIIPKNYDFSFVGKEDCQGRPCWRLAIKPKRKDKFLIDGDGGQRLHPRETVVGRRQHLRERRAIDADTLREGGPAAARAGDHVGEALAENANRVAPIHGDLQSMLRVSSLYWPLHIINNRCDW